MATPHRTLVLGLVALALTVLAPIRTATQAGADWHAGDVFLGLGDADGFSMVVDDPSTSVDEMLAYKLLGTYRVIDASGVFREDLTSSLRGVTTGCAVDRVTGDLFGTSFADVTVERINGIHGIDGHAATSYAVWNQAQTMPGASSIESIVFDRDGNYYVGIPDERSDDPSTGAYDGFGTVFKFTPEGVKLAEYRVPVNTYPAGYRRSATDATPRGADWIDLSADGRTLFYTSEDRFIRTVVLDANPQQPGDQPGPGPANPLTINGMTYPATPGVWGHVIDARLFALRLLPPGDGSGGLLVAGVTGIHRVHAAGAALTTYTAPDTGRFFAVNLSPDAQYVWTATQEHGPGLFTKPQRAAVFKFHVPTGRAMKFGTSDRLPTPVSVNGMCVKLEYTSQSVDCAADPGNPLCRAIEFCNAASPGDDDGDGLADAGDPDCAVSGAVNAPPVLSMPDQILNEGDMVDFIIPPATDPDGDAVSVCVAGHRPDGIGYEVLPDNSVRYFGIAADVQGDTITSSVCHVSDGQAVISVTLKWTVRDLDNAPPVCTGATASPASIWPPNRALVPIAINGVSDADGDAIDIAIISIEQNEPTITPGDRHTPIDGAIHGGTALVRAERAGHRPSRIYRIGFTATDGTASCSGFAYTVVPRDHVKTPPPPAGPWYNSLGGTSAMGGTMKE